MERVQRSRRTRRLTPGAGQQALGDAPDTGLSHPSKASWVTDGGNLWLRFWEIAKPYWFSLEKWKAGILLVLLILLLLGQTMVNVMFNNQSGEFTSALAAKDGPRFWHAIALCFCVMIAAIPVYAFYYYVRDTLGIHWRRWLTNQYLDRYFKGHTYYKLNYDRAMDNPDQRISEDINTFTRQSLYFALLILGALLQLILFSGVLWSISHELVYFLVLYTIVGTLISAFVFGRVMIGLNFFQLRREADFRFSLIRVRENAESITFHRGEAHESTHVRGRFDHVFTNFNKLIKWQFSLNLFQYGYGFLTIMLPSAIVASRVISGELEIGRAVQAAGAFAAVLAALAVIVENFESLSRFVAGLDRLSTFSRSLDDPPDAPRLAEDRIEAEQDVGLALEHVTLQTPNRERILIKDLTVSINPGEGLLIVGASGGGKSSLMRAIAGLWNCGTGRIVRPEAEQMLFLPQNPYMVLGSMRSQLLYPNHSERKVSDDELLQLIDMVNLSDVVKRLGGLDANLDWGKVLSVGEQQRLTFARVLLAKPRYAMLDEATSALDISNEQRLYFQLSTASTTLVSISHRPTLLKFHKHVLELKGDGDWALHTARDYRFCW
ncbi:ABC transporter ATP-binding protein/permease [Cupriavidus pauculus]|uniref:ABC transporter ATP-binding protein n=1 Tax=Cupriavidus pauculus TaxID=82633 RepID=A0A2N5C6X6_9BURK|nr:ABC transporter ATP-binding protein/permease [Cupriavidus pauculus]PLP97971.1 ABC transporter ATP-binding protein [Cupriavidus pauculus]